MKGQDDRFALSERSFALFAQKVLLPFLHPARIVRCEMCWRRDRAV